MSEEYTYTDSDGDRLSVRDGTGDHIWIGIKDWLVHVPADKRREVAQAVAGDEWRVVPAKDYELTTDAALDKAHKDLGRILDALGLGDHARPYSPHQCVTRDVLPAIERLREQAAGEELDAAHAEIDRLRDRNQQLYSEVNQAQAAQPDRPEPVDEVRAAVIAWAQRFRPGDIWDSEDRRDLESALEGNVEANPIRRDRPEPVDPVGITKQVFGTQPPSPKMLRECANILETAPYQRTKTAAWLRDVADVLEPEPDEAAVEALYEVYEAAEAAVSDSEDGSYQGRDLIRELARRNVRLVNER